MKTCKLTVVLSGFIICTVAKKQFEFGLMENEPLLKKLFNEEKQVLSKIYELNSKYKVIIAKNKLKERDFHDDITGFEYVQHPINAYTLIKSAWQLNNIDKLFPLSIIASNPKLKIYRDEYSDLLDKTEVLKTVEMEEVDGAKRAWVVFIHTYDMDSDLIQRGLIDITSLQTDEEAKECLTRLNANDFYMLSKALQSCYRNGIL